MEYKVGQRTSKELKGGVWHLQTNIIFPFLLSRANRKQPNLSVIQANLSDRSE